MATAAPLPVVLSVPHGGTEVPQELKAHCRLSLSAILMDNDTWARDLFSLSTRVAFYGESLVARAIIDMNRDPRDRPPQNPDGVVKTLTVFGEQVWDRPEGLPSLQADQLIAKYHGPFHQKLRQGARTSKAILGVDCHTMLAEAPPGNPHAGEKRPLICLSNRGGTDGNQQKEPLTAPPSLLYALKDSLNQHFQGKISRFSEQNGPVPAIAINSPFKGGYIIRRHADTSPIPWIQVEFNRCLYLPPHLPLTACPAPHVRDELQGIREKFVKALAAIL
jgi:N-formylglutamate deformylase